MTIGDRLVQTLCQSLCEHQTATLIMNLTTKIWRLESEVEQMKAKKRRKKFNPQTAVPPWALNSAS